MADEERQELSEIDNEEQIVDNVEEENSQPADDEGSDQEVVARAKQYGHLSKEEWAAQGKDPDQWKSPEEFDKTGKMIDQIKALTKRVEQRDREIDSLVQYQQRTSQREYEKAKAEIQQQIQYAKDNYDIESVEHYTRESEKLQSKAQNELYQTVLAEQAAAMNEFKERNSHWFNEQNPDLVQRAIAIDNEIKHVYPNATYRELAEKIETRMKYEFPERVEGRAPARQAPVISNSQSGMNKSAVTSSGLNKSFKDLSQELKDTYYATKRCIESRRDGSEYTIERYMEQLKKDGEI